MALAAAGVPFRIIPGVTAALGALAAASIPATLRGINRAVIFAAGHGAEDDAFDWAPLARTGAPIVLYMVMHNLERIAAALMRGGLATANAGGGHRRPRRRPGSASSSRRLERVAADAREHAFEPPAIVVVGDIVAAREQLLGAAQRRTKCRHDRARPHRRRHPLRRRQDHDHACAAGRAGAPRPRGAGGKGRTGLYRSRIPRRRHRRGRASISTAGRCRRRCSTRLQPKSPSDAEMLVIEGVMGLFDGVAGVPGRTGATADLAARFRLPVLLVLDVAAQSQIGGGRGARLCVARSRRPHRRGRLNRVGSERHRTLVADAIAALGMPVVGALPRDETARFAGAPSRPGAGGRARRSRRASRPPRRHGGAPSRSRRGDRLRERP